MHYDEILLIVSVIFGAWFTAFQWFARIVDCLVENASENLQLLRTTLFLESTQDSRAGFGTQRGWRGNRWRLVRQTQHLAQNFDL